MKLTYLAVLSSALVGCDPPGDTSSQQGGGDADVAGGDGDTCTEIGTDENRSFELSSDHFSVCDNDVRGADRAFNWTAPATGFYQATAGKDDEGRVLLELREGLCSEEVESVLSCGTLGVLENGSISRVAFHAESGEQFTLIVDSTSPYLGNGSEELTFHVSPLSCPANELEGTLPATADLVFGEANPVLRTVSCRDVPSQNQRSASFVAPRTDSYRFTVSPAHDPFRPPEFSLLLLADNCLGEELVCASSDDAGTLEVVYEMQQGQQIVAMVDGNLGGGSEYESVALIVDFATSEGTDGGF